MPDSGDAGDSSSPSSESSTGQRRGSAQRGDSAQRNDSPQRSELAKRSDGVPFGLIRALFIGSGFTGLVDQIGFSKYLSYVVGSTAYAVSAVLAAFMTGLALGAHLGGKLSSRVRRPLLAYGVLELVVGAAVAAAPLAFKALTPMYLSLLAKAPDSLLFASVVRWFLAVLFVVVPTIAMGATLPLLSRVVGSDLSDDSQGTAQKEKRLGKLYAANTLGGALGALIAAYWILPLLGLAGTLIASAVGSAAIGLLAMAQGSRLEAPQVPEEIAAERSSLGLMLPTLAFASGALVFACEVIFTHLLALIIGNSAYAFGLILAVFLICLFVGASLAPRVHLRFGSAALPIGLAAAALGMAITLPAWDRLPMLFGGLGAHVTSFAGREAVRAGAAFLILVIPTTLMGLTFPLLLQRVAADPRVGAQVGRLTAINTLGAVAGALLTGYLLLPKLGSERALHSVVWIFGALALATLPAVARSKAKQRSGTLAAALAAIALPFVFPAWNLARLTSGVNVYFEGWQKPDEVLFLREDVHGGVTTVTKKEDLYTLYTNGKFQGNNGHEMQAQYSFAHFPSMFVSHWDNALVIGLGTGTTLGTLNGYPWKQIDVVEISPAIAEAAHRYFGMVNDHALDDPRVKLHFDDGRNYLLVRAKKYDFIGMELSSVWFAGASSLYSKEYYELVKRHLLPHGIFQQWVQVHHMENHTFARILNSLRQVFPHVALFYAGGQGVLVASEQPLSASRARSDQLSALPGVKRKLEPGAQLVDLLKYLLLTGKDLDSYIDDEASRSNVSLPELISSDDNLFLEYATPRGNVLPWGHRQILLQEMSRHQSPDAAAALIAP
ncbi:MAG: fused MFS/spermidine synthase [Polyangiaceae bacterium]|nr:fused MFS/spermidine synthase [Polyangiaceae bacterium]